MDTFIFATRAELNLGEALRRDLDIAISLEKRNSWASLIRSTFLGRMPAQITKITDAGQHKFSALDAVCVGLLLVYFLHFGLPALGGGFGEDEMMNLYLYWSTGTMKSIQANLCFWSRFPRPAGALYYLPLYHFFLLDPLPYRIVQISILAATIPIFFCLARLLSGSHAVAFLVFSGSFIYDVLCGFFYFAALTYYVSIREKGMTLSPGQLAIFLALYICALNWKEMAVSLPVIVLIYEALKYPWLGDWNGFSWRNSCLGIPVFVAM